MENERKGYIIEEDKKGRIVLKWFIKGKSKAEALVNRIKKYVESIDGFHTNKLEVKVELKKIKEEDWLEEWRKTFKPFKVID